MAFGMKQWIGATLFGLALVAAWRLPPEPAGFRDGETTTAEELRYQALRSEERITAEVLYRMLWSDSLSAAVVREADDGVAVLAPRASEATREQLRRFEDMVRRQVADRIATHGGTQGGSDEPMVFGFVFQPHDQSQESPGFAGRDRTETYVGTRDGTDYCLQVRVAHRGYIAPVVAQRLMDADPAPPRTDDLGVCRFYLSYGLAGSGIQAWLEQGGAELALEGGPGTPLVQVPSRGRRGALGFASFGSQASMDGTRCMAGIPSACQAFLTNEDGAFLLTDQQSAVLRLAPVTGLGERYSYSSEWFGDQAYILADLETEFGTEAFSAFWTSEARFPEAFEAAFGVDPGVWMVSWVDRTMGVDAPGPGLPRHASSGSMLAIGLLLGIAYWRRRERSVVA